VSVLRNSSGKSAYMGHVNPFVGYTNGGKR